MIPETPAPYFNAMLELHVPDFDITENFYSQLGFKTLWKRDPKQEREPETGYLVMQMEDNIICFWCGTDAVYAQSYFQQFPQNTPRGYGVELVLQTSNLEALYQKFENHPNITSKLQTRPWGLQDFRLTDPWGYYLRITSLHDVRQRKNAIPSE